MPKKIKRLLARIKLLNKMTDNEFREYITLDEAWEMLEELADYVERENHKS